MSTDGFRSTFYFSVSVLLIFSFLVLFFSPGFAAVPRTLNVQGRLDENGFLADGNYEMTFKIYRNQTGGNALFVETHSGTVKATNGYFSTILGDLNSLNLDFNEQYWLGITIENDSEASPRIALTSSSYALKAGGLTLDENLDIDSGTLFADISNNKIGIGTTAPNAELDVQGDINATGNISAGAFFGDGSNLIGINSSANDTNWVTEGKDFRELANLWAFFPSKTIGDANISSVSWVKLTGVPHLTIESDIDGNIDAFTYGSSDFNAIYKNSSLDSNWATEGKDFKELSELWVFFPYKTVGDANISGVSWGKIIGAPVVPVLNVPWQDANIADDITLTNLTQITNRSYTDLQDKPSIPAGGICDNNSNCNLTGTINTTSNAVISANLNVDSGTLFVDSSSNEVGIGTVSPSAKLDVQGDLNVAGYITTSSGGVTFPDGTTQTTAATGGGSGSLQAGCVAEPSADSVYTGTTLCVANGYDVCMHAFYRNAASCAASLTSYGAGCQSVSLGSSSYVGAVWCLKLA